MAGQHARSSLVIFGLLAATLVVVLVAASAGAVIVLSDRLPASPSPQPSPLDFAASGVINPARALGTLAGINDQDVVDGALSADDSQTAFAALLYSVQISDQTRTGMLLTMARSLAKNKKSELALSAVRAAADIAVLSPLMPDYSRAAALDQAGQIMLLLGKKDEAILSYTTAATIAANSGRIDSSYRRLLLDGLATDLSRAGRSEQGRTLRSSLDNAPPPDPTSAVLPTLLFPIAAETPTAWATLEITTALRTELASSLIASLAAQTPARTEAIRRQLEATLVAEDRLRLQIYGDGVSQSSNLLQRIAFARERAQWLAVKWRIARQGFGMSVVPEWEDQASALAAGLDKAYADYYVILRDVAVSLPGYYESAQAAVEIIQNQIALGRLGLPAGFQEADLLRELDTAQHDLSSRGGATLSVKVIIDKGSSSLTVVSNK